MTMDYSQIDDILLTYQQHRKEHPRWEIVEIQKSVQAALADQYPRLGKLKVTSLQGTFSKLMGNRRYQKTKLCAVDRWEQAGYGEVEYKLIHDTWVLSVVIRPDGTVRPGKTDDVNEAIVRALATLGHRPTTALVFELRCMFGWATTAEILKVGYVPGTMIGSVLQRQEPVLAFREDDEQHETLKAQVERHETELQDLRAAVAALQPAASVTSLHAS
jgi:hypothetical protein